MLQRTFALIVVFLRLSDALHAASRPYLHAVMQRGVVHMLDLEESGKEYIQMLNKTDGLIDNWNLTGNYEYWTQRHNKTTEYPIYPRASQMTCGDHLYIGPIENPVMAMYIWQFNNSIRSPFKLSLTVTAPLIPHSGVQRRNVNLNLNGAGRIIIARTTWAKIYTERRLLFSMQAVRILKQCMRNSDDCNVLDSRITRRTQHRADVAQQRRHEVASNLKAPKEERLVELDRMLEKKGKCKFSTTVTFDGWFAYHTKNKTSATNGYHSVGAGNLANTSARLVKTSDHALNYTIDGNYTQVIFFESTFKAMLIG